MFARFGLPDVVVTDGGPPFNSKEFTDFMERHGVKVMKSPPYNPSSNGQAERMVRVVKESLKKFLLDPELSSASTEDLVSYFLFGYRNSCLEEDSKFPSERLFSFKPKTLLDLIHPRNSFKNHVTKPVSVENPKLVTKEYRKPDWTDKLCPGDIVYYKNFRTTDIRRWLEAKFLKRVSLHTYQVSVGGRVYLAHRNQLKQAGKDKSRRYVTFSRGKENGHTRKRTREDDVESDSDDAEDFYGFPADSFVFRDNRDYQFNDSRDGSGGVLDRSPVEAAPRAMLDEELVRGVPDRGFQQADEVDPMEGPSSRISSSSDRHKGSLRRSRRVKRFRRDKEFYYY